MQKSSSFIFIQRLRSQLIFIYFLIVSEDVTTADTSVGGVGSVSVSASPSPVPGSTRARLRRGPSSVGSGSDWPNPEDDLDRLIPQHSTASLGVSFTD